VALFALVAVGVVAGPVGQASAAGVTWAGAGVTLPSNAGPGNVSELDATECPAPGNCVAIGDYQINPAVEAGLIEIQHGGSWTATEAPLPAGVGSSPVVDLLNISCPTVGSCVVVGFYRGTDDEEQGLVLTQQGNSWNALTVPLPADAATGSVMFSVSCAVPGSCAATGIYDDTSDHVQGVLLVEQNGSWRATQAPLPEAAAADSTVELISVSCAGPASCVAVGIYENGGGEVGLIERLSGGTWEPASAVSPIAGSESALEDVSCASATFCTAVGADAVGPDEKAIANIITPGAVTAASVPLPANAGSNGSEDESALLGVSCPTATYCAAVGAYDTTTVGSGLAPLVETYSGGSWAPAAPSGVSLDPSDESVLYGVSCSWPGSCTGAGVSGLSSGDTAAEGLVETLADGTWTQSAAILPANTKVPSMVEVGLDEDALSQVVSCDGGACVLAGSYGTAANALAGFLNSYPNLSGYQLAASDGGIFAFNAPFYGSTGNLILTQPVVGMAEVPDTGGYYEAASDGGVFAFHAPFYGSMGSTHLNAPIVGIAFDSRTGGYYEVASDGGVFAFNAPFYGSMGGAHLNKPMVGMAFDPTTGGYYEVASDGGVFAFNAPFQGSTGNITLNKPVVGMSMNLATGGYYEAASDGGIFAFNAPFQGSTGNITLNKPVVGMAYDFVTGGYYEVASDGGVFAFNAPFQGSTGKITLNKPVVGMGFG
jgi:hypothetical protein